MDWNEPASRKRTRPGLGTELWRLGGRGRLRGADARSHAGGRGGAGLLAPGLGLRPLLPPRPSALPIRSLGLRRGGSGRPPDGPLLPPGSPWLWRPRPPPLAPSTPACFPGPSAQKPGCWDPSGTWTGGGRLTGVGPAPAWGGGACWSQSGWLFGRGWPWAMGSLAEPVSSSVGFSRAAHPHPWKPSQAKTGHLWEADAFIKPSPPQPPPPSFSGAPRSWDSEALGEDANVAVTMALQPRLIHCGGWVVTVSACRPWSGTPRPGPWDPLFFLHLDIFYPSQVWRSS